ncbi:DctP family TRAP transporter solute-binding subunit [Pseudorhodoferax soli]|uniref:Tripartite ATP-independent transporter DctP family solute receptor n=1 Tax=Pseudorhodoferax soli TaxID=545864 RepID=A0A368Y9E0_9BURK|nr:DctP family TRAP transporter solute-binding subunit [Pseudorhodoferax soli]RCW76329.1 tripartite ATP-independent transporter DctP family solute receptor [Pseudorhodoferax soli]
MHRTTRRLFTAALATLALASAGVGAQDTKRARLGHSFADSHPRAVAMKQFAADVAKATGGKVQIDVYGSAQLGAEDKMLIATQSGTQDLYMGALAPISARRKELQIFDFPFIFGSDAEAAAVLDGPVGRKMLDGLGEMNMQGLVWAGGAFRNMSNSKRPLTSMAEMKGLKVRVMQSPMALASFNAMGMNAVPMAFSEVYPALEIKALDGYEHPVVDMFANKMFEVQKYLTITNHVYTPVALVASKRWWSSLTPEQQQAVQKVAEDTRRLQRNLELKDAADVVGQLKAKGMAVNEMPAAELDKIRAAVQPVIDKNMETVGADFARSFYAEVAKARAATR